LLDSDTTPKTLAVMVSDLLDDPAKLATMADKARGFGHPDAAERLAQVVREQAA
jgi:UDP-N-acetylglucosamine--N-acetylmuramyl-(pentapeptide) pyrophosphoryl-undecaprenol N-acetylglucosamine transferase